MSEQDSWREGEAGVPDADDVDTFGDTGSGESQDAFAGVDAPAGVIEGSDIMEPEGEDGTDLSAPAPWTPPGDFKQNWRLLFCCVGLFIGAMWLPIERPYLDLYARDSIAGGIMAVIAAYGIMASYANIYHRKMIMWPVLFASFDGFYIVASRGYGIFNALQSGGKDLAPRDYVTAYGPGFYVILGCSVMVIVTIFQGVKEGRKRDLERKEAAKAARRR